MTKKSEISAEFTLLPAVLLIIPDVTSKYIFEGMARIPVDVDVASEFRYRNPILEDGALVIIISQSGETADSLAALRDGKRSVALRPLVL